MAQSPTRTVSEFPSSATGSWQNWGYSTIKSLYLPAGPNSIRATAIGSSGANIDYLLVDDGLAADLNRDGRVDAVDWTIFKSGQGRSFSGMTPAETYFLGDLNGDLVYDLLDFSKFRAAYESANGSGSFAQLLSVPEPRMLSPCWLFLSRCKRKSTSLHSRRCR